MLSDPGRRAEYDRLFRSRPRSDFTDSTADAEAQDRASSNFFAEFARFFQEASSGAGAPGASTSEGPQDEKPTPGAGTGAGARRPNADNVFGDVFEELCVLSLIYTFTLTTGWSPRWPTSIADGAGWAVRPAQRWDTLSPTSLVPSLVGSLETGWVLFATPRERALRRCSRPCLELRRLRSSALWLSKYSDQWQRSSIKMHQCPILQSTRQS